MRRSERPAEECVHTYHSPAEERGERKKTGVRERFSALKPPHLFDYVRLLPGPGLEPVY